MNCMNCGAVLSDRTADYCPHCGANVLIQKKVNYLSKYYYNQGLEKAQVRDLSGAIACLKQSLTYNKRNIAARNLLGLAYFETGEVVAALTEWVISKNLQPGRNLANDYIQQLQANAGRLDDINDTIRKYNEALSLARQGHEDMAAIRLRKVLAQNPKLIKGYHLLALILMKDKEWAKARRILRRASRIDKTNTTTLRFLREIEDQIGHARRGSLRRGLFGSRSTYIEGDEIFAETSPSSGSSGFGETSRGILLISLVLGVAAGALSFWMLGVPAIRQRIYREANRQIVQYSEAVSSQGAELSRAQGQVQESDNTAEALAASLLQEKHRTKSFQALFEAYISLSQEDYDSAALSVQQVYESTLTDSMMAVYKVICQQTGVTGITAEQEAELASREEEAFRQDWEEDSAEGNMDAQENSSGESLSEETPSEENLPEEGFSEEGNAEAGSDEESAYVPEYTEEENYSVEEEEGSGDSNVTYVFNGEYYEPSYADE
ncbi:MAG: hypothetical protein IKE03_07220 [Blautia sp.]|nr:hypothetical protein [Blautia sp.]